MANTTNLDLVKPLGTDHALISVINSNMDKIDAYAGNTDDAIGSLADGLAILANGDTHAAITSGQFVYVRGHGTLADGLYQATANIAEDGTLSGSNLTADSSGGLNTVYDTLNSKISISSKTELYNSSIAKSSDSSWHSSSDNYLATLADYKKLIIQIGVHGALYNTFEFDVADIVSASIPIQVSCYWNSDNLGMISIQYNTLRFDVTAKTKDFAFDYALYGVA